MTWPLLVFLLRKRTLLVLLPCLVLISLVLRIIGYENGASLKFIHNFTLCRMDDLSFGSLAAIWLRSPNCTISRWRRLALLCIAVGTSGIVIARILLHQQSTIVSYTFFAISFVGLLGLSLVADPQRSLLGRILTARWVRFTGKISYGLYLLHMPLFLQWSAFVQRHQVLTNFPFLRNTRSGVTQFAIVFVVATFSWKFIESPLLRMKSRFPSGSKIKEPI